MQNAALAYGTVAKQIANPRELEADLLLKAAARLQAIRDAWDRARPELDEALLYNRKLWSIFLTSVTSSEHPLPVAIRQNIANLGLFVMNQTVSMMTNPRREQLESLISINRELAAGLLGRSRRAAPASRRGNVNCSVSAGKGC
jgi:flagellar protein FlaF